MLTKEEITKLIETAREYSKSAFVPRSRRNKGACVLTRDGEYFGGCQVEAIISGLGVCAEAAAIDHAVVHGKYQFKAIAVVNKSVCFPCGACLQYMMQFYQIDNRDIVIVAADTAGNYKASSLLALLPQGYKTKNNLDKIRSYKKQ